MADKIEAHMALVKKLAGHVGSKEAVGALKAFDAIEASARALAQGEPGEADMPAICAALGFDPTNHHNAAKCPYCTPQRVPTASAPAAERERGPLYRPCGQVNNGVACEWHRPNGERLCPDCNPRHIQPHDPVTVKGGPAE